MSETTNKNQNQIQASQYTTAADPQQTTTSTYRFDPKTPTYIIPSSARK